MCWNTTICGVIAAIIAITASAHGETVTVTTHADVIDIDAGTATVADLPGPDGKVSLSEALIATNNTPGHQTIGFAIPQDEWTFQFMFPGRVVLMSSTGFYFRAFETVTIDGTTQTAFTGDTNPDGCEVVIYQHELYFLADDCALVGFDSTEVFLAGSNALVLDNTGSMDITVGGGSGSRIEGNTGGTIKIDQSSDNVVVGNTVQRIRVLGGTNNVIGGPASEDRNHFTGYGYWNFSSGLPSGTTMQIAGTVGTVIENNFIGTTPDGLAQGNPASTIGVSFEGVNHDAVVRDNLIGGIRATGIGTWAGYQFGWAVIFRGTEGSNIELTGNTIGLDANGDPVLGSVWGIDVGTANGSGIYSDLRIGGALPGQGNVVAGHILNGVTIGREASAVSLAGNAIHDNGWLGIDLIPTGYGYGADPNDPLDEDTGGNGLQNAPVVTSAARVGASVQIIGTLHSAPSSTYTVELFASPECDDSGFGEGKLPLGATSTGTDAGGDGFFSVLLPTAVPVGWVVTSTATSSAGDTSEFSACVPVEPGAPVPGDATQDGVVDIDDVIEVVLRWGPCDSPPTACPADVDHDGIVGVDDVVMVVVNWST